MLFSLENQRRTKALSRTQEPEWNQTMVYEGVPPEELPTRYLEVTTWNYDVSKPSPAMGGVVLDLSGKCGRSSQGSVTGDVTKPLL